MGTINLWPSAPPQGDRIGVFFWASDCPTQAVINEYKAVLQNEGYTKFFDFKDTTNFADDFDEVADYEDADDTIFFFLAGHGSEDYSRIDLRNVGDTHVYSHIFRNYCDTLDSTKVGLLVSSCYSGDFADDMEGGGYLAITSSDVTHMTFYVDHIMPGEGVFSNHFFYYVSNGFNAVTAYNAACNQMPTTHHIQNPQICDESSHTFFG